MSNIITGLNTIESQPEDKKNFNSDMLPENMQHLLNILTNDLKWDKDYCMLPMIITAAAAIGNARITEIAGYKVYSILYGCSVGNPSVNKSEPAKFAAKPLQDLFITLFNIYQKEYKEWEAKTDKDKGSPPKLTEIIFNDITIEKVACNLEENTKGAFLYVDELKGLFNSLNKYKGSNTGEKYIEMFSCTPLTDSRMGRKTVLVHAPFLSIFGTTQPDVIHRTFRDAANNGFKERILFVYPDVKPLAWNRKANKEIREVAQKKWNEIIFPLFSLKADEWENGNDKPVFIPFTPDAKEELFLWQESNTKRKIFNISDAEMLGKADVICPRLSLILQLIEQPESTSITQQNAIRAINLMEYFLQQCKKVKQVIMEGVTGKANVKHLLFELLPDEFTTQEAYARGTELEISPATIKRYLQDGHFCTQVKHGHYEKCTK